jgi:hypothetical protein
MYFRVSKSLSWVLALGIAAALPIALTAQDAAKPASKAAATDDSPSKWDIFAGYSYLAPHGTVGEDTSIAYTPQSINYGAILSVARYFNNYLGVQLEADEHILNQTQFSYPSCGNCGSTYANDDFSGGGAGLIFRFPSADVTPFVHALVGVEYAGVYDPPDKFGAVLTAGGGMDYKTPFLNHHLSIRVFQADYQYTHEDFAPGYRGNFKMARLSTGFVYSIGTIKPPPALTLACSSTPAAPISVFPGDPITVTATPGEVLPKFNVVYAWSGDGASGTAATATISTASLAPGSYTAKASAKEGKPGKEGLKPGQSAECSVPFTVKQFEPPTISCSANPTSIIAGDSSTITSIGASPQNRPLTYSYKASAGTIDGTGTTAKFSSTGAPTGAVEITCSVSDDKSQVATATTTVTINPPPPPPVEHVKELCNITFEKDKKRPTRVDNEAKACLDQVALDLQQQSDAKAVVVGESDAKEKAKTSKEQALQSKRKHPKPVVEDAAQRAVNSKEYLVTEKGIDATRISVATGTTDGQTVEDYLVPARATFADDVKGTTPVDETAVKPEVRKPLGEKPVHHKKAATK